MMCVGGANLTFTFETKPSAPACTSIRFRDATHSDTSKYHYQLAYRFRPGSRSNKHNISGPNVINSR